MKTVPFLKELVEARLFNVPADLKNMPASKIAELIYLMFMLIEVIRAQDKNFAAKYASDTMTYNTYETMHYNATDLGNLLAVLNNQDLFKHDIKVDTKFSIPLFQINRYLRGIASGHATDSDDVTFFWQLEDYLKLYSNSTFRQLRRQIGQWKDLSHSNKINFINMLRSEFDKRASNVDIYLHLKQNFKLKESVEPVAIPKFKDKKDEFEYIRELNGNIPMDQWCALLEQHLISQPHLISESIDQRTLDQVTALQHLASDNIQVGKKYIPVMIVLFEAALQVFDVVQTYPAKSPATFGTLVSQSSEGSTISIQGKQYTYPPKRLSDISFIITLLIDNEQDYEKFRLMMKLTFNTEVPPLAEDAQLTEVSLEESIPSLEFHEELNPKIWDENQELHADVKEALGKIANKFSEYVDVKQLQIVDYIITGSNCAFNYTPQSDIDLHVIVDATKLGENSLLEPFLLAKKSLWNSGHDITIRGYTVELYAEDVNKKENTLVAAGQYSLLHDKWIVKPTYEKITIDDSDVQIKAEDIIHWIRSIIKNGANESEMSEVRRKIKKMRQAGLDEHGEYSVENLAFKVIRNSGIFDKMNEFEKHKEDSELSLESIDEDVATVNYEPQPLSGKAEVLIQKIQNECGQMLAAYQSTNSVLWRGMSATGLAVEVNIRPDRRPVEMPPKAHAKLEKAFNILGLKANRTNSIFCTCDPDTASDWGNQYVIFVKDGWEGTVFETLVDSYFFDSIYDAAVSYQYTPEQLATRIKKEMPTVVTPSNLKNVLQEQFMDILITGRSYYAIRYGTSTAQAIFNKLGIRL